MGTGGLIQHDEHVFSAEHALAWKGVTIPVRMTALRLADGQLVLHSPIPITPALERALMLQGRVSFIVVPRAHGRFAAAAARRFPQARVLAAPFPSPEWKDLTIRDELADQAPLSWLDQIDSHVVQGFRLNEVVLFHRAARTLVLTDLCFNIHAADSFGTRLFLRLNGAWKRFGPSRLIRTFAVSDRAALRKSVERILEWDFERIVPGHGAVLERGGREAMRKAWLG